MDDRCVVLYVDDEDANALVFSATFEDEFEVVCASSGAEALTIVASQPIAIVVTDQRMPGMTGVELCERLRGTHPHILRVLITAYPDHRTATDGTWRGGITRYLHKPWSAPDVRVVLRDLIARVRRDRQAVVAGPARNADAASPATEREAPLYTLPSVVRDAVKLGTGLAQQQLLRGGRVDLSGDADVEVSADLTDVACILAKLFATASMTLCQAGRPEGVIRVVVADRGDTVEIRVVEEAVPDGVSAGVGLTGTRRLAADIGGELIVGDIHTGLGFVLHLPAHAPHRSRAVARAAG